MSFDIKFTRQGLTSQTLNSIYQLTHCFTLQTRYIEVNIEIRVDSMSLTRYFIKVQRHDDLIKAYAVR